MVRTEGRNRTKPSRLVIYNRVDKAGSSTLQTLILRLKKNLTECVLNGDAECALSQEYSHRRSGQNPEFFQPMTAFFCGHEPFCRRFNSRPALQKALQNLELKYSVVGVLETFRKSLSVFEAFVPEYFKNIGKLYDKARDKKVNQNPNHAQPPAAVRDILARRMTSDIELYMFAKQRLHLQFKRIRPRPQRRLTGSTAV
ncbi:Heparan sulfate 2-O-sulfotransferase pipe [Amphibalanus amphitrite]|uniref:Heparan sulfate 2-O-sulfotransferase pipe n=1 Tax=Amphibalanus amphitrite TaxID=1232801 RepID=A0A6A4W8Y7_AMPAM|nr:Heparan sulfate 2-O-sulfotransferase pipe [Amphibalanus amphitrite]